MMNDPFHTSVGELELNNIEAEEAVLTKTASDDEGYAFFEDVQTHERTRTHGELSLKLGGYGKPERLRHQALHSPTARDGSVTGTGPSWPGLYQNIPLNFHHAAYAPAIIGDPFQHFDPLRYGSGYGSLQFGHQYMAFPALDMTGSAAYGSTVFDVTSPLADNAQYWPDAFQPFDVVAGSEYLAPAQPSLEPTPAAAPDAHSSTSSHSSLASETHVVAPTQSVVSEINRCPHGCPLPIRRPGDYRRHMRKHEKPRFKCPAIDCDKTFYRADKMRDHVRQGHKGLLL